MNARDSKLAELDIYDCYDCIPVYVIMTVQSYNLDNSESQIVK